LRRPQHLSPSCYTHHIVFEWKARIPVYVPGHERDFLQVARKQELFAPLTSRSELSALYRTRPYTAEATSTLIYANNASERAQKRSRVARPPASGFDQHRQHRRLEKSLRVDRSSRTTRVAADSRTNATRKNRRRRCASLAGSACRRSRTLEQREPMRTKTGSP
jgi:hypothetical protein